LRAPFDVRCIAELVQVESDVTPWARTLLHHLPRESPAPAAKVEYGIELRLRHVENWIAGGIIERGFVCRTDELTHLEGWNGQWIIGAGMARGAYFFHEGLRGEEISFM
jgi:hypothetical protein